MNPWEKRGTGDVVMPERPEQDVKRPLEDVLNEANEKYGNMLRRVAEVAD